MYRLNALNGDTFIISTKLTLIIIKTNMQYNSTTSI